MRSPCPLSSAQKGPYHKKPSAQDLGSSSMREGQPEDSGRDTSWTTSYLLSPGSEGSSGCNHLIQRDPQGKVIHRKVILLTPQQLRGHETCRARRHAHSETELHGGEHSPYHGSRRTHAPTCTQCKVFVLRHVRQQILCSGAALCTTGC